MMQYYTSTYVHVQTYTFSIQNYRKRRIDAVTTLGDAALTSILKESDSRCAKQLFF